MDKTVSTSKSRKAACLQKVKGDAFLADPNSTNESREYVVNWGAFSLIEFIGSSQKLIGSKYKTALDIGSGAGVQTEVMRHAGLEVYQVDKYSENADFRVDFIKHGFKQKFDIIYCSHVIEHQRNVGAFLDKIFDTLEDHGLLLISAPKHSADRLVEGHLNCFFSTYFIQHLIHAGFDCKSGKYLSCWGTENAAIVPKADNFCVSEREEDGFAWTAKHQQRSFLPLELQTVENTVPMFYNCEILSLRDSNNSNSLTLTLPLDREELGIKLDLEMFGVHVEL